MGELHTQTWVFRRDSRKSSRLSPRDFRHLWTITLGSGSLVGRPLPNSKKAGAAVVSWRAMLMRMSIVLPD